MRCFFFLIIRTIIFPAEKNQQKSLRYVILIRQKDRRWLIGKWEVALELSEKIIQQRETGVLLGVSPGTSCMSHPIKGPSPQKYLQYRPANRLSNGSVMPSYYYLF